MVTLRKLNTYDKKHRKFVALKKGYRLKFLELSRPEYDLPRVVKERYPTPTAAISDMEDCLSLIALFCALPNKRSVKC